jgi:hypothetical protein
MKHTGKKGTITIRRGGRKPRARPGFEDMRTSECDVHARNALPDPPPTIRQLVRTARQVSQSGPQLHSEISRMVPPCPPLAPWIQYGTAPTHGWPLRGCGSENPLFGEACIHVRRREIFTMYVPAGIYYLKPKGYCTVK